MRIASFFSGIGGLELGVSAAEPDSSIVFRCEQDALGARPDAVRQGPGRARPAAIGQDGRLADTDQQ